MPRCPHSSGIGCPTSLSPFSVVTTAERCGIATCGISIGSGGEGLVLDVRERHAGGPFPIRAVNFVSPDGDDTFPAAPDVRNLLRLRHEFLNPEPPAWY